MQAIHSEFVTDNKQKVVILNTHTKVHYKNLLLEENEDLRSLWEVGDDHVTNISDYLAPLLRCTNHQHVNKVLHGNYSNSGNFAVFTANSENKEH